MKNDSNYCAANGRRGKPGLRKVLFLFAGVVYCIGTLENFVDFMIWSYWEFTGSSVSIVCYCWAL